MQRFLLVSIACLLAAASSPADDVTDLVPSDAYGYVVIADVADLDAKLLKLGQQMKLPIPGLVAMINTQVDTSRGINLDGSVLMAVLPADNGTAAALFVPVDDYDAFVGQLDNATVKDGLTQGSLRGKEVVIGKKGEHAAVARTNHRETLKRVLEYQVDADQKIKQPDGDYDIAGVVTTSGTKKLIGLGQQGLREATRVLKEQAGEDNPALAGLQLYDTLFTMARDEVNFVTASFRFDEDNSLYMAKTIWVQPDGKLAPILKDIPVPEQDLLSGLPNVPYVMALGGVIPENGMKQMIDVSKLMMGSMKQLYKMEPEQIDAMMDLSMKYFSDMRGMSFLFGAGQGDDALYNEMVAALYVDDADKYMDDYLKYWDELSDVIKDAEGSFMQDASLEVMTLAGNRVLKMNMPIPRMANIGGGNQEQLDEIMTRLYGSTDMTMYIAAGDKNTVLIAYTNPDMLHKAWQAKDNESELLSNDPDINGTKQRLPENPLIISYWSPSGSIAFANRMMAMMPATNGFQLPEFPETPPVGWTMHAKPQHVVFQGVMPIETFEGIGEFANTMMMRGKPVAN